MTVRVVVTLEVTPEEIRSSTLPLEVIVQNAVARHINQVLAFFMKPKVVGKDTLHIKDFAVERRNPCSR